MPQNVSKTFIFFGEALLNLVIIALAILIVTNLIRLLRSIKGKEKFQFNFFDATVFMTILGFSFLGFAIGLLIGLSQSPVVHVAIPALLTFYGGFLTFLFAKDSFKDQKGKIATILSVMAVSFFLIYGVEVGSREKNAALDSQKKSELYYFELQEEIKKKYR